ncbi:TPA: hypothetical protein RQ687_004102 [Klebsiella pneumoniae]|uniref:hypothetical protein n=1 Tax=Klebsiella pneumoniae TaxID=573 RepID=UPI000C79CBD7|nr:hypothetical protein CWN39_01145 [Klebsiella pneumoniae]HCF8230048.1 hypothetical protein [Klebsiella pneumoniae]HDY5331985.1 hypothetical protein [Klebsiella pneumoniae]
MNEQANKILVDLLQKASDGIDAAVSFSQAQIPDVISQLMTWKMVQYGLRIGSFTLLLAVTVWLLKKYLKEDSKYAPAIVPISALFAVFSVVVVTSNIGNALQLWIAPKVWMIEYAASLMNQS